MAYQSYNELLNSYLSNTHGRPVTATTDWRREFVSTSNGQTYLITPKGIYQVNADVVTCPGARNARTLSSIEESIFMKALQKHSQGYTNADDEYSCRAKGDRERWDNWIGLEYTTLFGQTGMGHYV